MDTLILVQVHILFGKLNFLRTFVYIHESIDMFLLMWIHIHKGTEYPTCITLLFSIVFKGKIHNKIGLIHWSMYFQTWTLSSMKAAFYSIQPFPWRHAELTSWATCFLKRAAVTPFWTTAAASVLTYTLFFTWEEKINIKPSNFTELLANWRSLVLKYYLEG